MSEFAPFLLNTLINCKDDFKATSLLNSLILSLPSIPAFLEVVRLLYAPPYFFP